MDNFWNGFWTGIVAFLVFILLVMWLANPLSVGISYKDAQELLKTNRVVVKDSPGSTLYYIKDLPSKENKQ